MRVIAISIAAVLLLAGCGGSNHQVAETPSPSAPAVLTVTGNITVDADSRSSEQAMGGACVTGGGYSDVQTGAQVTVSDSAGKVLALGALDAGVVSEVFAPGTAVEGMASLCAFWFTVTDVPDGQNIYSVEVSHRGKLNYTREKLDDRIELTLG